MSKLARNRRLTTEKEPEKEPFLPKYLKIYTKNCFSTIIFVYIGCIYEYLFYLSPLKLAKTFSPLNIMVFKQLLFPENNSHFFVCYMDFGFVFDFTIILKEKFIIHGCSLYIQVRRNNFVKDFIKMKLSS